LREKKLNGGGYQSIQHHLTRDKGGTRLRIWAIFRSEEFLSDNSRKRKGVQAALIPLRGKNNKKKTDDLRLFTEKKRMQSGYIRRKLREES